MPQGPVSAEQRGAHSISSWLLHSTSWLLRQWAELLKVPLERAVVNGYRGLARKLVWTGAQIGDSLHKAIQAGHGDIASDLLESGASVDSKGAMGGTPLHVAAFSGNAEMVQQLLLKGADKDAYDNGEWTPLCTAAAGGHVRAAQALLAAGASVSLGNGERQTPVIYVAALKGHVEVVRAVIEHGADVKAGDVNRYTALHAAAFSNSAAAIDLLVEAGASIHARNNNGDTPLHPAACALSHEALLCLLKHGATVNAKNNTDMVTPLMLAAGQAGKPGGAEVVDSLLRAGADETIVGGYRRTAEAMVGTYVAPQDRLAEDVWRVRKLLASSPADRVWHRRGYLVLCRAFPDRLQVNQVIISTRTAGMTNSCAKPARAAGFAGDGTVGESTGGSWAVVLAKVLGLQEEDIFRTIVRHL